jgi:hypothetical protein
MVRLALLAVVLSAAACTAKVPAPPAPDAFLLLHVQPDDATVRVDDRVIGSARTIRSRWVAVSHGRHRLAVNAPGFDPLEEDVELAPGRHERTLELAPTPER